MIRIKSLFLIGLYRFLMWSWRIRIVEADSTKTILSNRQPAVLAHWHGDEYSLIHLIQTYSIATMTSTSNDGEIVTRLIQSLGGKVSRGSSTRKATTGLRGLVRLLKAGHITSIAVDGPRGPYHVPKPGAFELSRLAGAAVIPVGVYVSSAIHFKKAWNKAYLPLPFAKIQVYLAEPLDLSLGDHPFDPRSPELSNRLTAAINDASSHAARLFNCDA